MQPYVEFLILGIGSGSIIAALALGLVLTYRASGVINLGHGAIAAYIAYSYSSLRVSGDLPLLPLANPFALVEGMARWLGFNLTLPDIPAFIRLGQPMSTLPASALALCIAAGLGLTAHFLVFRPLRYAPPLAKLVASVGIMIVLESALVLRFGSGRYGAKRILPASTVEFAGADVPLDRLILLAIVVGLATALWLVFTRTHFGIATRAAAEDERAATFLGVSADFQAGISWVLASVVAGVVGILAAPITGLLPSRFSLLIIPAVGAALLGNLSSFGIAAVAGLSIGMIQSEIFVLEATHAWFPHLNLQDVLPFLVIVVAVIMRGDQLPTRRSVVASRLPRAYAGPIRLWTVGAATALLLVAAVLLPSEYRGGLNNSMIGTTYALSLVVLTGFLGQISLVQSAIAGVAAFGLATFYGEIGLPLALATVLAVAGALGVGLVVAVPALRVRAGALAVVTLASGVAIEALLFKREGWFGARVSKSIPPPELFGFEFGPSSGFIIGDQHLPRPGFSIFVVIVTIVLCLAVARLRRSALGARMLAVRVNERAAAGAGINVESTKLIGFGICSLLAGLAGALSALSLGTVSADSFGVFSSLTILAFAYLGGISTVTGAVIAGLLFTQGLGAVIGEEFIQLGRYTAYAAGILLLATAVINSEGIDAANRTSVAYIVRRVREWRHRTTAVPRLLSQRVPR